MREFLFADCHKQLPFRETRRGMTRARPRMRPCPARTRRYGRRSSRVNASATRARPAGRNVVEEGRLEFHPASGYNYPGRTPASKVSFRAERGTPQFTHRVIVRSFANAQDNNQRDVAAKTHHRFCPPRLFRQWRRGSFFETADAELSILATKHNSSPRTI